MTGPGLVGFSFLSFFSLGLPVRTEVASTGWQVNLIGEVSAERVGAVEDGEVREACPAQSEGPILGPRGAMAYAPPVV